MGIKIILQTNTGAKIMEETLQVFTLSFHHNFIDFLEGYFTTDTVLEANNNNINKFIITYNKIM